MRPAPSISKASPPRRRPRRKPIAAAEADTLRAEAAQSAARQALDVARQPLAEAERNTQRLETEAKTLARLLHVENKQMWPPVIDLLTVEKGYETALGAALGDDLDAPVEATAPIHWGGATVDAADPALPEGVAPLTSFITAAPDAMARRLAQIGVVARSRRRRGSPRELKPGQRLVSQEGDLWRWDGFAVAANAPTAAARRLAGRNRLADIEAELRTSRGDLDARRQAVAAAESEVAETREAENDARGRWRAAQREADAARDRHAAAERELNRITSRRSALTEAQARVTTTLAETQEARGDRSARTRRPCAFGGDRDASLRTRAPPSAPIASGSPRCAPKRRRSPARSRSPSGVSPRSPPRPRPGPSGGKAPRRRSRPSRRGSKRPGPSTRRSWTRRPSSRRSSAR